MVKKYYQFLQDAEEEERWAQERIDNCRSANTGKDLNAAMLLLKKHDVSKTKVTVKEAECLTNLPSDIPLDFRYHF